MAGVHRNGDQRSCGAANIVSGQGTVYANTSLVSVDNDPNSHGGGTLNAANPNVYINNKLVVIQGNSASPDGLCPILVGSHCSPHAVGCSGDVKVGG
jgi:hypothetical protein